jgi:hypothetical protein
MTRLTTNSFLWRDASVVETLMIALSMRVGKVLVEHIHLLYASLLTPVASCNPLLYQSLPISISCWDAIARRRKDDLDVGTASRRVVA